MRNFRFLFLILTNLSLAWCTVCHGQEDLSKVYGEVNGAVAIIDVADSARGVASGVVVGILAQGSALILTARHVVKGYDTVNVSFELEEIRYDGLVSQKLYSESDDLALVIVRDPPANLEVMKFRESTPKIGTIVGTIGHPGGELFTWSDGSINNIYGKYLVHDALLDVGSSGGPLLDTCGRLLGINVRIILPPEKPPEELAKAVQDTAFEVGSSVTLSSGFIVPIIKGWFGDKKFKKNRKWKFEKYCSTLGHMFKDPWYIVPEGLGVIFVGILGCKQGWWCKENGTPIFGEPKQPPSGQ